MSYWLREVAGWLLLVAGLVVFGLVYDLLLRKRVFEAGPLVFVGFVVFRGGLHLLKVAMAARASRNLTAAAVPNARRAVPASPPRVAATDVRRVVPGPAGDAAKR